MIAGSWLRGFPKLDLSTAMEKLTDVSMGLLGWEDNNLLILLFMTVHLWKYSILLILILLECT